MNKPVTFNATYVGYSANGKNFIQNDSIQKMAFKEGIIRGRNSDIFLYGSSYSTYGIFQKNGNSWDPIANAVNKESISNLVYSNQYYVGEIISGPDLNMYLISNDILTSASIFPIGTGTGVWHGFLLGTWYFIQNQPTTSFPLKIWYGSNVENITESVDYGFKLLNIETGNFDQQLDCDGEKILFWNFKNNRFEIASKIGDGEPNFCNLFSEALPDDMLDKLPKYFCNCKWNGFKWIVLDHMYTLKDSPNIIKGSQNIYIIDSFEDYEITVVNLNNITNNLINFVIGFQYDNVPLVTRFE